MATTGPDPATPLEVQRAAWHELGRPDARIDLAAAERELDELRLWQRARVGDEGAIEEIARRELAVDQMLAAAEKDHESIRADPAGGYLYDRDGEPLTSESFDLAEWLAATLEPYGGLDSPLLRTPEGRRALTWGDPLLFALIYLPHHLKTVLPGHADAGVLSFADFHLDLCRNTRRSVNPVTDVRGPRDCYVAPRDCGKTTWNFLAIPMWEAAHGHQAFIAAFADSAGQAEIHLMTFRNELKKNVLLRRDFPDLCKAALRQPPALGADGAMRGSGMSLKDNESMYIAASGFVFAARGVDTASLGLKVEEKRPSKILLDDVEPKEGNYSADGVEKRLRSIIDAILPLNLRARVVLVGTVTRPGSIIHQLVDTVRHPGESEDDPERKWIGEQGVSVHYYAPIIEWFDEESGATGQRSIWPAKWPLEFLLSICGTRDYLKNFENDPLGAAGLYWTMEDFGTHRIPAELQAETVASITHQLIAIDPATTTKKTSDYTALAVIGFSLLTRRCVVREAVAVRVQPGAGLRKLCQRYLDQYPMVAGFVVESNQGGEVWLAILGELGLPIEIVHHSEPKEVRASRLLDKYQKGGRCFHERPLRTLEANMVSFPGAAHDDLVDGVGTGVEWFLDRPKPRRPGGRSASYV